MPSRETDDGSDARFEVLREDPELTSLVERQGRHHVEPADDAFERLVVSIVRQQVSMSSAEAIRERLFDEFTVEPAELRYADAEELRDVGLSEAKASYVRDAAETFGERGWTKESFGDWSDDRVRDELQDIRGVGRWTADMFLIFVLGRDDVFPVGDLGVRKAMEELYGHETRSEMVDYSERWSPYRSTASLYLWNYVD